MTGADFAVVGTRVPRIDSVAKATAKAQYLDDIVLPGMLVGKFLRSPYAHARIKRIDATRAEALPGVVAVATGADCPDSLTGWTVKDLGIFPRDKVRWIGEPVAAVAAIDEDTAERALGLIDVEYEELPAVFDPEEALKQDAPIIHEGIEGYAGFIPGEIRSRFSKNLADYTRAHRGDIAQGFKEADFVFEDTFRTCRQYACSMETRRVIAQVDSLTGEVSVWSSSQLSGSLRASIAELLRIPIGKISVKWNYVGGAFGSKTEPDIEPKVVALAAKAKRPIKLVLSRAEDFTVCCRAPVVFRIRTGVKKDGQLVAREIEAILDTGAVAAIGALVSQYIAEMAGAVYKIPNVSATAYAVYTNNPRAGALRGFGQSEMCLASESQIDMIAERLGIDPLELRLRNAVEEGDSTNGGRPLQNVSLKECLRAVADRADWGGKSGSKTPGRGIGLGCSMTLGGGLSTAAMVRVNDDGTVGVVTGQVDMGQGSHTALVQIAAEELGVPMETVKLSWGDTDFTPFEIGAFADRGVSLGGAAVQAACREAKQVLLKGAAELLGAGPLDLDVRNGLIYVREAPERAIPVAAVAGYCSYVKGAPPMGCGVGTSLKMVNPGNIEGGVYFPTHSQTFAVAAVEVEVDRETGMVKVLNVTQAADCGRAINPMAVEGQSEQTACFGIAQTLAEEMMCDQGKAVNTEFSDYLIPTAVEAPRVDTVIVEVPEGGGPFGAKGLSDAQPGAVVAATVNAICNAVGARIKELPVTPERVLAAMRETQG